MYTFCAVSALVGLQLSPRFAQIFDHIRDHQTKSGENDKDPGQVGVGPQSPVWAR